MKKWKSQLQEKSMNQLYRDIDSLYNIYKNKFKSFSDLINFISEKLQINKNDVLQVLQIMEKENFK
jgi:hypothetical protein